MLSGMIHLSVFASRKKLVFGLFIGLLHFFLLAPGLAWTQDKTPTDYSTVREFADLGRSAFQKGDFAGSVSFWSKAANIYKTNGDHIEECNARIHLGKSYQALGRHGKSLDELGLALDLAHETGEQSLIALVNAEIGMADILSGKLDEAGSRLEVSLGKANHEVVGLVENYYGHLFLSQGNPAEAIEYFTRSFNSALLAGDMTLATKSTISASMTALRAKHFTKARDFLKSAVKFARSLPDSHDKAFAFINIGQVSRHLDLRISGAKSEWTMLAHDSFGEAISIAERIENNRAFSFALGYMGQLYESERRHPEALHLTRKALFAAQQSPEILYQWQWQIGRIHNSLQDLDEAASSYRQAVDTIQSIRKELSTCAGGAKGSFKDIAEPIFFGFVDILLKQAAQQQEAKAAEGYLEEARNTTELLKEAELQDFFQDECVRNIQGKKTSIDQIAKNTAVIYAILLPDRLELLVSLPSGLRRYGSAVASQEITNEIRKFRLLLEKRTTRQYLPYARKLYDWLIRPIESDLLSNMIDTLIFVPDAALRTIPMAALHDGENFLITKFTIATTPGLNLVDPRPIRREQANILLTGLTVPVQGFPALVNVADELDAIQRIYKSTVLRDQSFLASNVSKELKESAFSIVHIASHGKFEGEGDKSFLLTFDGKLDMNQLESIVGTSQYRDKPVELLTLSACQTAAGDDRAALGLAGVAIKAGARSALATLWFISDKSTTILIEEFYKQFKNPDISKAKALQQAQIKLILDRRYRHPGYWAPFLLIGNWL